MAPQNPLMHKGPRHYTAKPYSNTRCNRLPFAIITP